MSGRSWATGQREVVTSEGLPGLSRNAVFLTSRRESFAGSATWMRLRGPAHSLTESEKVGVTFGMTWPHMARRRGTGNTVKPRAFAAKLGTCGISLPQTLSGHRTGRWRSEVTWRYLRTRASKFDSARSWWRHVPGAPSTLTFGSPPILTGLPSV
jgi:hypothetical protein